jgi:hypothetical protein
MVQDKDSWLRRLIQEAEDQKATRKRFEELGDESSRLANEALRLATEQGAMFKRLLDISANKRGSGTGTPEFDAAVKAAKDAHPDWGLKTLAKHFRKKSHNTIKNALKREAEREAARQRDEKRQSTEGA